MSTVQTEGDLHGKSAEVLEGERRAERERWNYEPWSPEYERRVSMEVVTSGSMIAATAGMGALALTIIALCGVAPAYLIPIATIVIGSALMFEGGAVTLRFWKLPEELAAGQWASASLAEGMMAAFLSGVAGLVLGILAVTGVVTFVLVTICSIIFGGALILTSGLTARLNHIKYSAEGEKTIFRRFRIVNFFVTSLQFLAGCSAITLGILGLAGIMPVVLTTVALLIVASSLLLSGSAITSRIMHLLRRC